MTLVALSRDEILLLTRRGEVLVCRHLDYLKYQEHEEFNRLQSDMLGFESESCGNQNKMNRKLLWGEFCLDSKALCCKDEKEESCGDPSGGSVLISCGSHEGWKKKKGGAGSKSSNESKPKRLLMSHLMPTQQPLKRATISSKPEFVEDEPDLVELNNVSLQNQTFWNNLPTPVMSFDYHGYEPPTPEPIPSQDRAELIGPTVRDKLTKSNLSFQNKECLHLIRPGAKSRDRCILPLPTVSDPSFLLPGVPKFLHLLSYIRVTCLSAHPLGRHVLLISEEGLLFSYGSNDCGQLGLGKKSCKTSSVPSNGNEKCCCKVTVPSIITPLLENGGKSINCAAGIDYSLVVVKTEGARIASWKQQARQILNCSGEQSPNRAHDRNAHHQMYGFGNNNNRKLGLLDPIVPQCNSWSSICNGSPRHDQCSGSLARRSLEALSPSSLGSLADDSTDEASETDSYFVFLPRRVALYCKVIPQKLFTASMTSSVLPPFGIFSVAASSNDSAALVRRPSGAIELYTWGREGDGALALVESAAHTSKRNHCSPTLSGEEAMSFPEPENKAFQNSVRSLSAFMTSESPVDHLQVPQKIVVTPTILSPVSFVSSFPSVFSVETLPHSLRINRQHHLRSDTMCSVSNPINQKCSGPDVLSDYVGDSLLSRSEHLVQVTMGPSCTHVITSKGRWLAYGTSADILSGLGINVVRTEVTVSLATSSKAVNPNAVAAVSGGDQQTFSSNHSVPLPHSVSRFGDVCVGGIGIKLDNKLMHHIHPRRFSSMNSSSRSGDAPIWVQESGRVLSFGRKSAQFNKSCVCMDIVSQRYGFGGMELWCDEYKYRLVHSSDLD